MKLEDKNWKLWTSSIVYKSLLTTVCAGLLLTSQVACDVASIQSVSGKLYAENFTYYKLSGEGWLRLELYSIHGDVDLYVSGLSMNPSFTEYELKSDTCGIDTVDIPSSMTRPVWIGLYGHPFYIQSEYKLDIQLMAEEEADEYEQLFRAYHYYNDGEETSKEESKTKSNKKSTFSSDSEDEAEESIWWTILITFLKFILEVIV